MSPEWIDFLIVLIVGGAAVILIGVHLMRRDREFHETLTRDGERDFTAEKSRMEARRAAAK